MTFDPYADLPFDLEEPPDPEEGPGTNPSAPGDESRETDAAAATRETEVSEPTQQTGGAEAHKSGPSEATQETGVADSAEVVAGLAGGRGTRPDGRPGAAGHPGRDPGHGAAGHPGRARAAEEPPGLDPSAATPDAIRQAKITALRGLMDGAGTGMREEAEAALRTLVGRDDAKLYEDQWQAIEALVAFRRRALVVQRTGWGKSAVYLVATKLLRARGAGPTVVISPLLALMRDQIAAATRAGVRAVTVNSANVAEWDEVHAAIAAGEVDVLLCSPERLNNPGFRDEVLPRLAADAGLVVIDEAHCISDWGHDFRPDYRRIRTLLADLPPGIPVLATTATANSRVTADVAEQLATGNVAVLGKDDQVLVLRGNLDRESLHLAVVPLPDPSARLAWLTEALEDIDGSGIVYTLTVAAAEQTAAQLRAAGLAVAAYTGQTEPAERERLETELKNNEVKALIATSALGMGFDKPDLAFVVHLGAPPSPIAYYQQVGRAGRGVSDAVVILLPGAEDQQIWDYFGSLGFPAQEQVRATLDALGPEPTSLPQLETRVDLRRSRLEAMLKVLDVDGAVHRVSGGWVATGLPWVYDDARYARVEQARQAEQQAMVAYAGLQGCRMAFLRAALDDPELKPGWTCGRCDRCGGVTVPGAPDPDAIAVARAELDRPGVEVATRRQWPTGMDRLGVDLRGRLGAGELAEPGRAVARLDALGWAGPLRDLFAGPDGEVPVALRRAAVRVLDEWRDRLVGGPDEAGEAGAARDARDGDPAGFSGGTHAFDGVVAIRSVTRPQLGHHLATGLATYLKVPFVGTVGPAAGQEQPGNPDVNSAARLAAVARRLNLELSAPAAAGMAGRRILLVDDYTQSGWTLTVAARLLRQAGAGAVYPFVLAVR